MVLGGGGAAADHEIDAHPTWRAKIFGCGSMPQLPPKGPYTVTTGSLRSTAMGRTMPFSLALPWDQSRLSASNERIPLILALPGEGGTATDVTDRLGLPNYANRAGMYTAIVSPGGVGSSYYHPRHDGTDMLTFLVEELVPHIEQRQNVGRSREMRALYGCSMGGYGALLIAAQRPEFACAAAAASPAVFPSYHDAITGHPATFDSDADWQRYGVWDQLTVMGRVPVRIDCGDADPFAPTARHLLERIPGAVGGISRGCHDLGFWRAHATQELAFLKNRLSS